MVDIPHWKGEIARFKGIFPHFSTSPPVSNVAMNLIFSLQQTASFSRLQDCVNGLFHGDREKLSGLLDTLTHEMCNEIRRADKTAQWVSVKRDGRWSDKNRPTA